jgi:aryl-alcohol dehydrogenase-like predicted oxidoreductase
MDKRILGSGGLEVSALGFGCMGMSQSFGSNPGNRGQMMSLRWARRQRASGLADRRAAALGQAGLAVEPEPP